MARHSFFNNPLFLAGGLAFAILVGSPSLAQIASPSNAGGNAGNNASGSSTTPVSTPTFNVPTITPTIPGITVEQTPQGPTITTAPATQAAVNIAVAGQTANPLAPVVQSPSPAIPVITPDTAVDVTISINNNPPQQQQSAGAVLNAVENLVVVGNTINISNLSTNTAGSIVVGPAAITVTLPAQAGGTPQVVSELNTTPATQAAVLQVASMAVVTGMTAPTLQAAVALVNAGAPTVQVINVMLALQTLLNPSTGVVSLNALSTGIDAFNSIVNTSSPPALALLGSNPAFLAARDLLAQPRSAIN